MRVCIIEFEISYWDDGVGTFDPEKVLRTLEKAFPIVNINPIDQSQSEFDRTVAFFRSQPMPPDRLSSLIRQADSKRRRCGPSYHFEVGMSGAEPIPGSVSRYRLDFRLSENGVPIYRERLHFFLDSLMLGHAHLNESWSEDDHL